MNANTVNSAIPLPTSEELATEAVTLRETNQPSPIDKVVFRSQTILVLGCVAAVGWTLAAVDPFIAFWMAKPDMGVAVVDPAGNWHFTRLNDLWSSETVYHEAANNIALALLSRNPSGSDDPLLLKMIFTEAGRLKAKKMLDDSDRYFKDNQIFQSVKCGTVQVVTMPDQDGKKITRATALCRILQNGTMNGAGYTEPFTIKLTITLVKNDDFLSNGMFPLVANDFTLERMP